ncbi:MAG: 4-hydroxy-tetrahydrodipicolinate reductase [Candidatus Eremiobacteraeota bacterium]|nr:4-hydroxy-tetrahydrodipicolinate reductase [Candidatus Eremiobacteraeota bacterium]
MRVGVAGALGRMGRTVCAAVSRADDMELVGGFDQSEAGRPLAPLLGLERDGGVLYDDLAAFYDTAKPDVVVDFTVHPITVAVAREAIERGISPVIGATGRTREEVAELGLLCQDRGVSAALVPNFSIGAVLMMRYAENAAHYFPTAEVIELHHDAKKDAPSGTARLTADRIQGAMQGEPITIHSVRLRGLVAHQEVLFGGEGEVLTIRHDSLSRESFMPGVLLAIRSVRDNPGLTIGLDTFVERRPGGPA